MVPILHPLPLDWTGQAVTNMVFSEEHDISDMAEDPYKVVVLDKGYFYTHDLVVYNHLHQEMIPDVDYQCIAIQPEIVSKTGFGACAVIVVTNTRVRNKVYVTARMVGGEYCELTDAIINMAQALLIGGKRKVYYRNLKDKPHDFLPNGHQHTLWQLYRFTPATNILKRMVTAQNTISSKDFDSLYQQWRFIYDQQEDSLVDIENRLTTHINDTFDPHGVTKVQVRLSQVYNGLPATADEARQASGAIMNAYATPLRTKESIEYNFLPQLQQHITDFNNPHKVTWETLGSYSVQGLQSLANNYYNKGETTNSAAMYSNVTWDNLKVTVRSNLPATNLTSGRLPWSLYSMVAPPAEHILSADPSGYMTWRPIRTVLNEHVKKGNQVIYLAGDQPMNAQAICNIYQAAVGPKPDQTVGIYKWTVYHNTGTGNGGITVVIPDIGMVVCMNGVWTIPAYMP